jgi:Mor family transcriptional regulator
MVAKLDNKDAGTIKLPASLDPYVELLGLDLVLLLVEHFGGTRIYVPKRVDEKHRLVEAIGLGGALKLVQSCGGEQILVPKAGGLMRDKRNREIIHRYDSGDSVRVLAKAYNLTDRQIYTILNSTA